MNYQDLAKKEFPYEGEFFLSRNKKYEELIFFVHFYGGSKKQLMRHIRMVNGMGFDAFAFQLQGTAKDLMHLHLPLTNDHRFGLKHAYAEQIEHLLNDVPGQKIAYAFSNPCASAIEAMARRKCSDTPAMICDSGPTARLLPSAFKLFDEELNIKSTPVRLVLTPFFSVGWSPYFHKDIHADLEKFPDHFRLLSIRGWKDKLIPPSHIDEVFDPHTNLDWQKLSLPDAGHLLGLRDFKKDYVPAVESFLKNVATPI